MSLNLKVLGLTLEYDAVPILDGIDFELQKGEMVALLGPNGAGKSSLLRCISGIIEPKGGSVFLNGREAGSLTSGEIARQMAVVPQDTGVDFDFTVEEIVQMGRFPYRKGLRKNEKSDEEIVRNALETTGILPLRHRSAATLSGGERQRMVFARALCQEPELLLLDEPTANLDIGYQWELLEVVLRLNREKGVTIIAAIHDLNLAALFFQRFILLSQGKILAVGRGEEVLTKSNILTSYGVPAQVFRHPLHGRLQVSVSKEKMSTENAGKEGKNERVHIIGGGSEALPVLEALWEKGYSLSLGPVSNEDSGSHFARFLGFPVIENPPFSGINAEVYEEHLKVMKEVKCVVLPPIPFGEGNIRNLEAMVEAVAQGVPGIVLGDHGEDKDFTGGKAAALLEQMKEKGALFVNDIEDVLLYMKGCGNEYFMKRNK